MVKGRIESISIDGQEFIVAHDAYESPVVPPTRVAKVQKRWSIDGQLVELAEGDQVFLQELFDDGDPRLTRWNEVETKAVLTCEYYYQHVIFRALQSIGVDYDTCDVMPIGLPCHLPSCQWFTGFLWRPDPEEMERFRQFEKRVSSASRMLTGWSDRKFVWDTDRYQKENR